MVTGNANKFGLCLMHKQQLIGFAATLLVYQTNLLHVHTCMLFCWHISYMSKTCVRVLFVVPVHVIWMMFCIDPKHVQFMFLSMQQQLVKLMLLLRCWCSNMSNSCFDVLFLHQWKKASARVTACWHTSAHTYTPSWMDCVLKQCQVCVCRVVDFHNTSNIYVGIECLYPQDNKHQVDIVVA